MRHPFHFDWREENDVTDHHKSLESVSAAIMANLAPEDPLERVKLVGAVDLGQRIATFLQTEVADEGSWVDTGSDGSSYDCKVEIGGREFSVSVSAGDTDEEVNQFWEEQQEAARQWDALWPRVREILQTADKALADQFEKLVKE